MLLIVGISISACTDNDNAHTTATTYISPPPRQILAVISKPVPTPTTKPTIDPSADPRQPMLIFDLANGSEFKLGDEVPIAFSVMNAKLKGDGGEFRVRYIVDDEDMKWLESADSFWLSGWTPGEHTIRLELIGPDGWPYKNGNANILTREIMVAP